MSSLSSMEYEMSFLLQTAIYSENYAAVAYEAGHTVLVIVFVTVLPPPYEGGPDCRILYAASVPELADFVPALDRRLQTPSAKVNALQPCTLSQILKQPRKVLEG